MRVPNGRADRRASQASLPSAGATILSLGLSRFAELPRGAGGGGASRGAHSPLRAARPSPFLTAPRFRRKDNIMDGRQVIVGADHDYDALMQVGAEPSQQGRSPYGPPGPYGPPPPHYLPGGYPPPQPRYPDPHGPRPSTERRVYTEPYTRSRNFPVGFVRSQIPPGQIADIEVKPQVLFKGQRLAVSSHISRFFTIVDIKVGKDSQLAATGEMPADCFSELAVGVQMELDTAQPGIVMTLRVRNFSSDPQNFMAVLYGAVME